MPVPPAAPSVEREKLELKGWKHKTGLWTNWRFVLAFVFYRFTDVTYVLFKISTQVLFIPFRRCSTQRCLPSRQPAAGRAGSPGTKDGERQPPGLCWGQRGWEEGAWPCSPQVAGDPHRGEPSTMRGLHHPRHGARAVSGAGHSQLGAWQLLHSGNKQPSSAQQGSCCNKRLLEKGRAAWNSQENSPDPGLLTPGREKQPPCPSWAPVLSHRKTNQPGVPSFGIIKCPGRREGPGLRAVWAWCRCSVPSTPSLGTWFQEVTLSTPREVHHFAPLSAAGGSRDQPLHTWSLLLSLPYQKGW